MQPCKKTLAWILLLCLSLSLFPMASAEQDNTLTFDVQSIVLSGEKTEALTKEELNQYMIIADQLASKDVKTVSLRSDGKVHTFRMKEETDNVLSQVTYTQREDSSLSVISYSDIVLPDTISEDETTPLNNDTFKIDGEVVHKVPVQRSYVKNSASDAAIPTLSYTEYNDQFTNIDTFRNKEEKNTILDQVTSPQKEDSSLSVVTSYSDSVLPNAPSVNEAIPLNKSTFKIDGEIVHKVAAQSSSLKSSVLAAAIPALSNTEYYDQYRNIDTIEITAERLVKLIDADDQNALAFAKLLGFGRTAAEIRKNLQELVDEYYTEIGKGNDFEEPRFLIHGVDIVLNKTVEEVNLQKNADGTYNIVHASGLTGYRTSVMVDAGASVTIRYDEKGQTKIERRVKTGKPTDFVIALDVSGSMEWDGRDTAMFSALKVVLEEILSEPQNTVSLVFWSDNAAVAEFKIDDEQIKQVISGNTGDTLNQLYAALLMNRTGNISSVSLNNASIYSLESLYGFSGGTEPDQGLEKVMKLLGNLDVSSARNIGVLLFTDGEANYYYSERQTVELEKQMAEQYDAKIVNVSIGDEYNVSNYERYLDPNSTNYYAAGNQTLKNHVLYYNIPKLTNQELADKVSEIFEVAFEEIVTETKKLKTETITDGILAAYAAQLIETIPSGFEVVEISGETPSYQLAGTDANGKTQIIFDLGTIVSEQDRVISYCVIPTGSGSGIGVTAYADDSETILYTQPVDRIEAPSDLKTISIKVTGANTNQDIPDRPDVHDTDRYPWMNNFKPFADKKQYTNVNKTDNRISGSDEWKYLENFIDTYLDAGFPLDIVKEYAQALAECEDNRMREMILMMFSSDIVKVEYYPNGRSYVDQGNIKWQYGSYENVYDGQITVRYIPSKNSGKDIELRTIFHELGHAMDSYVAEKDQDINNVNDMYSVSSNKTSSQNRVEGIKKDVKTAVKSRVNDYVTSQFPNASQEKSELYTEYVTYQLINKEIPYADLTKYDNQLTSFEKSALNNIYDSVKRDFNEAAYDYPNFLNANEKDEYMYMISDVLGGITANNLIDSCGHWDKDYWYMYDENAQEYIKDNMGNAVFGDWRICEVWAEYTECVLGGFDRIDDVLNRFFPSFGQNELRDDMHSKMADSLHK